MVLRVTRRLSQRLLPGILVLLGLHLNLRAAAAEIYAKQANWVDTMLAARTALGAAGLSGAEQTQAAEQLWFRLKDDFPVQWDWALQDGGADFYHWFHSTDAASIERRMIEKALADEGDAGACFGRSWSGWRRPTLRPATAVGWTFM